MSEAKEANEERCETCRFVERTGEDSLACRRYPPRPYLVGVSVEGYSDGTTCGGFNSNTEQPEVLADDWCGEWQAKRKG